MSEAKSRIRIDSKPNMGCKQRCSHANDFPPFKLASADNLAYERKLIAPAGKALQSAQKYLQSGDLKNARAECNRSERLYQGTALGGSMPGLDLVRAQIEMKRGNFGQAARMFEDASKHGFYIGMHLDMAFCYVKLRRYDAARRHYSDSKNLLCYETIKRGDLQNSKTPHGLEANITLALGLHQFFTSRPKEALETLQKVDKLTHQRSAVTSYYIGMSLVHLGKKGQAIPYFKAASSSGGEIGKDAELRSGSSRSRNIH